jgi:hypothetical protein
MVKIGVVTFAPAFSNPPNGIDEDYSVIINDSELIKYVDMSVKTDICGIDRSQSVVA